ncbi:purine-cytosine permease family protein [Streptomyces buecherae]|uniref:Cytosine permease n=1 Tax=Streptomyces buecherae TaxID=2763006 RepID=A0A7H8N9C6_9ACTN|nr:cytosine permease [Streptomyces buecherae]QKW50982.1 cytosine permease [Streptomyces buecherae]
MNSRTTSPDPDPPAGSLPGPPANSPPDPLSESTLGPPTGPPADPPSDPPGAVEGGVSGRATRIEAHGVDPIPEAERRGHPRQLFSVWAAANVNYLNLVVGGALVLMGLNLWQAVAVIVVGNLCWLLTGLLATSGPAAGAPSEVITRAMYGVIGNRVNNAIGGWLVSVCYFALNLAAAATAAFALVERAGAPLNAAVKAVVIVVIAALTLVISVYGHQMIVKLYRPITLALAAVFTVVGVAVIARADFSYRPAEPLTGTHLWTALVAGATMVASGPLSYTTSADFSRYLPRATPRRAIVGWTAAGGVLPSLAVCSLGACAATVVDMADPQRGLEELLPGWFTPLFLLALVLGTIAINALTAYSAGLALQAVGIRIRRSRSVLVDGTVAVALTLYGLLVSGLLDTVRNALQLTVILTGPMMAVYATDIALRGCRYDGPALADETPGGPYWYSAGVNWRGALALTAGVSAAALCADTVYAGPIAVVLGGVDLSLPVGMGVSAVLYATLGGRPR